ncbi:hypothetical protein ACIOTI_31480 [Streptomyces sp. NPDC087843]
MSIRTGSLIVLAQPADGHLDTRPVITAASSVRNNGPHLLGKIIV